MTDTIAPAMQDINEVTFVAPNTNVVIIIPAYNEERFIGTTVLQARKFADTVIVIDDGSKDATADVADRAGATVVQHQKNSGKGVAVETGFGVARQYNPDVVIMMDADGQHIADELPRVAQPVIDGEADIVVGSRYLEATSDVPTHRVWGHRVFNTITHRTSGVKVTDSQSGFRAFSARAIQVLTFSSAGFSVESEMQFLAHDHNLRVVEVPITILYTDKAKRNVFAHGWTVLDGILRLTGQYRPLGFFGTAGMILLMLAMAMGLWVVNIYHTSQELAIGYSLLSILGAFLGSLLVITGVILHSVRGLLIDRK